MGYTSTEIIIEEAVTEMSGKRIIESMKEALAISRGELPPETYKIHIPVPVAGKTGAGQNYSIPSLSAARRYSAP